MFTFITLITEYKNIILHNTKRNLKFQSCRVCGYKIIHYTFIILITIYIRVILFNVNLHSLIIKINIIQLYWLKILVQFICRSVLQTSMQIDVDNASSVTFACVVLHNLLIKERPAAYLRKTARVAVQQLPTDV